MKKYFVDCNCTDSDNNNNKISNNNNYETKPNKISEIHFVTTNWQVRILLWFCILRFINVFIFFDIIIISDITSIIITISDVNNITINISDIISMTIITNLIIIFDATNVIEFMFIFSLNYFFIENLKYIATVLRLIIMIIIIIIMIIIIILHHIQIFWKLRIHFSLKL